MGGKITLLAVEGGTSMLETLLADGKKILDFSLESVGSIVTTAMNNDVLRIPLVCGLIGLGYVTYRMLMPRMGRN